MTILGIYFFFCLGGGEKFYLEKDRQSSDFFNAGTVGPPPNKNGLIINPRCSMYGSYGICAMNLFL